MIAVTKLLKNMTGEKNTSGAPENRPIMVSAPGFLTFIRPIAQKSAYIGAAAILRSPNRVVCITSGMVIPPQSVIAAERIARKTKSLT